MIKYYTDIIDLLIENNILNYNYTKKLNNFNRVRTGFTIENNIVPYSIIQETEVLFDIALVDSILHSENNSFYKNAQRLKSIENINLEDYLVINLKIYNTLINKSNVFGDIIYLPKNTKININPINIRTEDNMYYKDTKLEIITDKPIYKTNKL